MLPRAAALILFASTLAWSQAAPPVGCANLPQTRANPDEAPKDKKTFTQRLKEQFSGGCANIFLTTCWGDQNQKPPANTPGAPESKDKGQPAPADKSPVPADGKTAASSKPPAAPDTAKQSDALAFPEDQSRRAQEAAQGVSSSKQNPNDPLAFPEDQSRRAQDAAQGVSSSNPQHSTRVPEDSAGEMEVVEMKPYDPHKAEKDIEVGDFYYKRQNYKAAIGRYEESLQLRPGSPSVTFKLADAYEKDKKPEQAAIYYSEYVRQYPKGRQIAQAQAALQRLAPVVRADADQLKQAEIAHDLQAGEMLMAQKKYPDAMQRFCDVSAIAPNPRALFRLAQSQEASGDFPAAYQNFQGYLKLEPEGPFAAAARREISRLAPQVQQGRVTSPSADSRP